MWVGWHSADNWRNKSTFIPRPSHCPVFDHLQYAKTGRWEGVVHFITQITSRQRREKVIDQQNAFRTCMKIKWQFSALWMFRTSAWLDTTRKGLKLILSVRDPSPPSVYLGRHWHHFHVKMDHAFPLHFAYCKKNWSVGRSGNKARMRVRLSHTHTGHICWLIPLPRNTLGGCKTRAWASNVVSWQF